MSQNLTMFEVEALDADINVSDGHPRMTPTAAQRAVIQQIPQLFELAGKQRFEEIELTAHATFLHGLGQHAAPIGTGRMVSCYSSSVAMDIVARALAERGGRVALIEPTFDNIPDLLRGRGIRLHPLTESEVTLEELVLPADVSAVSITTPNNPTGWVLPASALARVAALCAASRRVLVLDTCFRAHDSRAQYDHYQILADSGTEWAVIEDTGKIWPMQEFKAGFLAWGATTDLDLRDKFSDMLLSISPVMLLMISALARDANAGGYAALANLIGSNRDLIADAVATTSTQLADADSRISVCRLQLTDDADRIYARLLELGVHTLPCQPFHWSRPDQGSHYLRIALARDRDVVQRSAELLFRVLTS